MRKDPSVFCFISNNDKFIGTIDPKYEAIVKEFYLWVLANGDIQLADYEGLVSTVRGIR